MSDLLHPTSAPASDETNATAGSHRRAGRVRRSLVVAFGLVLAVAISACGVGKSGSGGALVEQLDLDLSGVDVVKASDVWKVEIVTGEVAGVEITIDDNLRDRVDIAVDHDEVKFELRSGSVNPKVGFNAVVTLASVTGVDASDAAEIAAVGLAAETLDVSGSDSAKITLSGRATAADVEVSDASRVDLGGFQTVDATVDAEDAARLDIDATGDVRGQATDAARITITGGAAVDVRSEDAASVENS